MKTEIYAQPIMNAGTEKIYGYETLVRGQQGEPPGFLFQQAARNRNLLAFDTNLIERSLVEGCSILRGDEKLFINVHPKTLQQGSLPALRDPDKVVFEMTEQMSMNRQVRRNVEALHAAGVSYAMDDYGKGLSNLDRFSHSWFTPAYVKLDRLFTKLLTDNRRIQAVIRQTVALCQETGTILIVEGVETEEQRDWLLQTGVQYMQGFLWGKPEPIKEKQSCRFTANVR